MNIFLNKNALILLGSFLAFAPTIALADSQLRIEWRIGYKTEYRIPNTEYRILNIEKNGQQLTVDTTRKQVILPTSGDCSRWDTSQLRKEWVTGMHINGVAYLTKPDEVTLQIEYDFKEFLGMKKHEFSPGCFVNNGSTGGFSGETTISVKKGKPFELKDTAHSDPTREYVIKLEVL